MSRRKYKIACPQEREAEGGEEREKGTEERQKGREEGGEREREIDG